LREHVYAALTEKERVEHHERAAAVLGRDSRPATSPMAALERAIKICYHLIGAGRLGDAYDDYEEKLFTTLHHEFGAYELQATVLAALVGDRDDPPRLDTRKQRDALGALAHAYSITGQPRRAIAYWQREIALADRTHDGPRTLRSLGSLVASHVGLGQFRRAEVLFGVRLLRSRSPGSALHLAFAVLMLYRGAGKAAEVATQTLERAAPNPKPETKVAFLEALAVWLRLRSAAAAGQEGHDAESFVAAAVRALDHVITFDAGHRDHGAVSQAYVLMAAATRMTRQLDNAAWYLEPALALCHKGGRLDVEPQVLTELAHVHLAAGRLDEAQARGELALRLATRGEDVLKTADAHLLLAEVANTRGDRAAARRHAEQAHRLATCDGPPDYTYKAAYDEATALLATLEEPKARPLPAEQAALFDQLRDSPAAVADLLARVVLRDPARIALLESPGTAAFLDIVQQHKEGGRVFAFVHRLREETREFQPNPLWMAWVTRMYERNLQEIGHELHRLASGRARPAEHEPTA
jgi:tetratricopeptide (TPR) repeat protein